MDWNTLQKESNDLYEKLHDLHTEYYNLWLKNELFTWRWWIEITIMIAPWVYFWFLLRKKPDTYRLVCAGFSTMIMSAYLDTVGLSLRLWGYPSQEVPLVPPYITWD